MSDPNPFVLDNIQLIRSGIDLLRSVSDETYAERAINGKLSGIGPHLRHAIDHYFCFLNQIEKREINYDIRLRNQEIETSRSVALETLEEIEKQLKSLLNMKNSVSLKVIMDCGSYLSLEESWCDSTVGRELQFLVSHTVHHYAILTIYLTAKGLKVPDNFGVAPSTVRHLANV